MTNDREKGVKVVVTAGDDGREHENHRGAAGETEGPAAVEPEPAPQAQPARGDGAADGDFSVADVLDAGGAPPPSPGTEDAVAEVLSAPEAAPVPAPVPEIDWKDQYLRLAADFDNYRKRTAAEASAARKLGAQAVMRDWLEVYDSTVRALQAPGDPESEWFQGVVAMRRQMDAVLARHKVKVMETAGARFDPHVHDALAAIPAAPEQDGMVLHTEQMGFVLEDGEVLRPARVVVGKANG